VGDPGCRNPSAFDFSLPPDAPACKAIGFVPFDDEIHKAGLYGDTIWRELAKTCTLRKPSPLWTDEDFKKLNAFDLDFNLMKNGDDPGVFHMQGERGAGFAVTSEVAGLKGAKCLKCIDKKGLSKAFYPYLQYAPHGLKNGNISFTFAVQQPASSPARLDVTLRSTGEKLINGPSLNIGRDGVVKAGKQIICTLKPGEWTQFEVRLTLGDAGHGHYTLVTRNRAGETSRTLPYANPAFSDIGWIGVTMPDDADGVSYLDDLKLQIME
jgi:hypothetical protein